MGIFVQDGIELETGVIIENSYVRVREIDIINNTNEPGIFQVVGICDFYPNKQARIDEKPNYKQELVSLGVSDISNPHNQIYTALKQQYETTTDDM
jgi:hypothetical protein